MLRLFLKSTGTIFENLRFTKLLKLLSIINTKKNSLLFCDFFTGNAHHCPNSLHCNNLKIATFEL